MWRCGELTSFERHFADHDPSGGEIKVHLYEFSAAFVQPYGHVPRVRQRHIRYVGVRQWLLLVGVSVGAEPDIRFGEYLVQGTVDVKLYD